MSTPSSFSFPSTPPQPQLPQPPQSNPQYQSSSNNNFHVDRNVLAQILAQVSQQSYNNVNQFNGPPLQQSSAPNTQNQITYPPQLNDAQYQASLIMNNNNQLNNYNIPSSLPQQQPPANSQCNNNFRNNTENISIENLLRFLSESVAEMSREFQQIKIAFQNLQSQLISDSDTHNSGSSISTYNTSYNKKTILPYEPFTQDLKVSNEAFDEFIEKTLPAKLDNILYTEEHSYDRIKWIRYTFY